MAQLLPGEQAGGHHLGSGGVSGHWEEQQRCSGRSMGDGLGGAWVMLWEEHG